MDIVVKGRRADVSEKFRQHATEKLSKVERLDHRIIRLEVEVCHEQNPRLAAVRDRVEVTCLSKGPIIRAEAASTDPYVALDLALDKLESRLRRAADKRRVHHGFRTPESIHSPAAHANGSQPPAAPDADAADSPDLEEAGGVVVREKMFEGTPMTLDEALFQMELVGHDFFLFPDSDTGLPSVVYRRKGYDYGVIRLAQ
ncbi:MAG TPA: ribosome-associated translation inhibitor RaiA [Mycobacteriales bacterium]|jgi:ribosomal subunit interface protein|nr:ribosome-associated translation inhibitor RaiA [Mycobacteriales bacterium]